ncbi:MAG: pilus assembly protein [Actinomycetota bacterium]|nr:pilus assembly protein [Actinomycetota bacterium]
MTSRRSAARERGVGTIEFLMVTPFVFLTVLGVIQVAYVAIANSAATDAARAAAHAHRNDGDPQSAASRAAGKTISSTVTTQIGQPDTWKVDATVVTIFPGAHVNVTGIAEMP